MVTIEFADERRDGDYLVVQDRYVPPEMIRRKIRQREVIVIKVDERPVGWLRYGYLWDEIPLMTRLRIEEGYRGRGLGTQLVGFWEKEMRGRNHDSVMTSALANRERAQHFYRTLGYVDCGALLLPGKALEIFFRKVL